MEINEKFTDDLVQAMIVAAREENDGELAAAAEEAERKRDEEKKDEISMIFFLSMKSFFVKKSPFEGSLIFKNIVSILM